MSGNRYTKKQKQVLLQDLSARLPWGVNILFDNGRCKEIRELGLNSLHDFMFNDAIVKPYLRPLESMTEEEEKKFLSLGDGWRYNTKSENVGYKSDRHDWLNKNHFDYRGLIPMGLALPAKEGMYNNCSIYQ